MTKNDKNRNGMKTNLEKTGKNCGESIKTGKDWPKNVKNLLKKTDKNQENRKNGGKLI